MANRSSFVAPNYTVDTFLEHYNISSAEKPNMLRYQILLTQASRTSAEDTEFNNLGISLREKIISPEDFNYLQDCMRNIETNFVTILTDFQSSVTIAQANTIALFDAQLAKYSDKGFWDGTSTYQQWNTTTFNGQTFRSKQDGNLNHTPVGDVLDLWWTLTAKQGAQGIGIGLVPMGVYSNSTSYLINQLVSDEGSLYYCINPTTGNTPSTSLTFWQIFQANVAPVIQSNAPTSLSNGLIWIDSSTPQNIMKYWNGTVWRIISNIASNVAIIDTGNLFTATNVESALAESADKIAVLNGSGVAKEKANLDYVTSQLADNSTQLLLKTDKTDNTKQIPHIGTTTNSNNAYSVTTTEVIATDQKFTIKINANSTGVATLNISSIGSAKGIKKAGGANATLKIGVYTLFYDGINFQLLGEGGEYGNVIVSDVRVGKIFGTEDGLKTGNLVSYAVNEEIPIENLEYYGRFPPYKGISQGGNGDPSCSNDSGIHIDAKRNRRAVFGYSGLDIYDFTTGSLIIHLATGSATRYTAYDLFTGFLYFDSTGGSRFPYRVNIIDGALNIGWTVGNLSGVSNVGFGGDGSVYILTQPTIMKLNSSGNILWSIMAYNLNSMGLAQAPNMFNAVIAISKTGEVWLSSYFNYPGNTHYLLKMSSNGNQLSMTTLTNGFNGGGRIELDSSENAFVLSTYPSIKMEKYSNSMSLINSVPVNNPNNMRIDADNSIYVLSAVPATLVKFSGTYEPLWSFILPTDFPSNDGFEIEKNTSRTGNKLEFSVMKSSTAYNYKQTVKIYK